VSFKLSDATIGPQASLVWSLSCSDLAIENALWGEKLGKNRGRSVRILTENELNLIFRVLNYGAKFHKN